MSVEPLITAGPGAELESGIYPSVDPLSAPFWIDGENVEFRKGGVTSSLGYETLLDLTGAGYELAQAFHEGDKRAYVSIGTNIYMYSSVTGANSIGSLPVLGRPIFETFGSWLLVTNGLTVPRIWKNTATLADMTVPFTFAKIIKRKATHIMALNTSNGQNAFEWSSSDDPDDWTPLSSNSAGNGWLRDLDSEIVAAQDMGELLAVYSRESMALISFVGQPNVFAARNAINGVGAAGPKSIIQVGNLNFGLVRKGVFQTDGFSFQYMSEPAVQDFLEEDVNFDVGDQIVGYHNEKLSSVIWFYQRNNGGRAGIGVNYNKGQFRKYSYPAIAAIEQQVFDNPLAIIGAKLVLLNKTHSAAGAALSKWVRTKPIAASDATRYKIWSHLKMVGKFLNAQVKIGIVQNPNDLDTIEWFKTDDMAFEVWCDRDHPFLILEFRADELDSYFELSQLQILGEMGGNVSI